MCYAVQLAYDDASDPVYNNGWQEGDDGGTGILGPWNFDGTFRRNPIAGEDDIPDDGNQQAMDNGLKAGTTGSSPYNDLGRAWTMFNLRGPIPGPPAENDTDIAEAGRAINGNLQVGSTIKIVIDNPTEQAFWRGWTIRLNKGGANGCYAGDNCSTPVFEPDPDGDPETNDADPDTLIHTRMSIGTFEYFNYGRWYANHTDDDPDELPDTSPDLFTNETNEGMRIEFTLTGTDTFDLRMIPLDNPSNAYEALNRTMNDLDPDGEGGADPIPSGLPIDWIEFEFYNSDSDFYPAVVAPPGVHADYNKNGFADAADYVIWKKMNGTGFNLDNEVPNTSAGIVNDLDYAEWKERFGNETATTDFYIRSIEIIGPGDSSSTVPEPGTFVFLVAGAAGLASLAPRRRRFGANELTN
jgi:hypothetical protein